MQYSHMTVLANFEKQVVKAVNGVKVTPVNLVIFLDQQSEQGWEVCEMTGVADIYNFVDSVAILLKKPK